MIRVIIWGSFIAYDMNKRFFELECLKGNMEIAGIILNEHHLFRKIDGYDVLSIDSLMNCKDEYIIDMNGRETKDFANRILHLLKIDKERIIPIQLFRLPYFDLSKWLEVRNRRTTILANQCWGGFVYHTLGLEFASPCINMWFAPKDFFCFVNNFKEITKEELVFDREEYDEVLQRNYPVARLGNVEIHMNHYMNFENAKTCWDRRIQRINYDAILVHAVLYTREEINSFEHIPYSKVGVTNIPCSLPDVISYQGKSAEYIEKKYANNLGNFVNHSVMVSSDEFKRYDLLKMLNGEEDFKRTET